MTSWILSFVPSVRYDSAQQVSDSTSLSSWWMSLARAGRHWRTASNGGGGCLLRHRLDKVHVTLRKKGACNERRISKTFTRYTRIKTDSRYYPYDECNFAHLGKFHEAQRYEKSVLVQITYWFIRLDERQQWRHAAVLNNHIAKVSTVACITSSKLAKYASDEIWPAILPSAHTACSATFSSDDVSKRMNGPIALLFTTTRVWSEVPDATFVNAHAASNWISEL